MIPATLADSLMSRLDRLLSIKDVAQRAAVIGREFSYQLLAEVVDVSGAELELALAKLCDAQIVFASGVAPDATYSFKHALVQEAAYASLLKRTRQQLHARIAQALKANLPRAATAEPEVVARHYEQAGLLKPSIDHYLMAGQIAVKRSADHEAIAHFRRGLALLETLPESKERDRLELQLLMALGAPLSAVRTWSAPDCIETYTRARHLASTMESAPELPRALASLAATYFVRAEFAIAIELAGEAILAAERSGDTYCVLFAHQCMGVALYYGGDFRQSLLHLLRAIELYDVDLYGALVYSEGTDRGVMAMAHAALCWHSLGYPDRAVELGERGVSLARRLNHPPSLAHAVFTSGHIHLYCEHPDPLRGRVVEMLDLAERFGLPMYSGLGKVLQGGAIAMDGDSPRALDAIRGGFLELAGNGVGIGAPLVVQLLADAQRQAGQYDDALASIQLGLALAGQQDQRFVDSELHRARGHTLMDSGAPDSEAEQALDEAISIAQRQEARSLELRAAIVLAQLRQRQGRPGDARALLEPLYAWFTEGFETGDLKTAKSILDALP